MIDLLGLQLAKTQEKESEKAKTAEKKRMSIMTDRS